MAFVDGVFQARGEHIKNNIGVEQNSDSASESLTILAKELKKFNDEQGNLAREEQGSEQKKGRILAARDRAKVIKTILSKYIELPVNSSNSDAVKRHLQAAIAKCDACIGSDNEHFEDAHLDTHHDDALTHLGAVPNHIHQAAIAYSADSHRIVGPHREPPQVTVLSVENEIHGVQKH